MTAIRRAPCSRCRTETRLDDSNPWRPFCSERCKMADLGDWLSERYALPSDTSEDFEEALPPREPPLQ